MIVTDRPRAPNFSLAPVNINFERITTGQQQNALKDQSDDSEHRWDLGLNFLSNQDQIMLQQSMRSSK